MKRRSMFGMMLGSVAGLFALRPVAKAVPFDPTKANRDGGGRAICRVYREAGDGTWREIKVSDIRAGDKIICIGQDGDRLWRAGSVSVLDTFPPSTDDSGGVRFEPGGDVDLMSPKSPK